MSNQQIMQQRRRILGLRIRRAIIILTIITFLSYLICIILYLLQLFQVIQNPGIKTLFTVLGVFGTSAAVPAALLSFLQHFLSFFSAETLFSPVTTSVLYHNILGSPPPINPKTIYHRRGLAKEIYGELLKKDTTAIVLTGFPHVGKSTAAALVYKYAEKRCHQRIRNLLRRFRHERYMAAPPLWLHIDSEVITLTDIAGSLFHALNRPFPSNFHTFKPSYQAQVLCNVLNSTKPRLVVIDQLDTLLNVQTGYVQHEYSHISQWIYTLNSLDSKCPILFTSRVLPREAGRHIHRHLKEHLVKVLEIDEGLEMLQQQGVRGTVMDQHTALDYCGRHPHILQLLISLFQGHHYPNLAYLLKDPLTIHILEEEIAILFDPIYKNQLDQVQQELLLAFSVFDEPVPLEVALPIRDSLASMTKTQQRYQLLPALQRLLGQDLLISSIHTYNQTCYHIPPIISRYLVKHFSKSDEQANLEAKREAHRRAGGYYEKLLIRIHSQNSSHMHHLAQTIIQHCYASQWQVVADLLRKPNVISNLQSTGKAIELQEKLQLLMLLERWNTDPLEQAKMYEEIGSIYREFNQKEQALDFYIHSFFASEEVGTQAIRNKLLNNIGMLFLEQEQFSGAVACFHLLKRLENCEKMQKSPECELAEKYLEELCQRIGKQEYQVLLDSTDMREAEAIRNAYLPTI